MTAAYEEKYEPVNPPAVIHPQERYSPHEFYVHLGVPNPEKKLLEMVQDWLATQPPGHLHSLSFSYLRATEDEPDMLLGVLIAGAPLDIG